MLSVYAPREGFSSSLAASLLSACITFLTLGAQAPLKSVGTRAVFVAECRR